MHVLAIDFQYIFVGDFRFFSEIISYLKCMSVFLFSQVKIADFL